MQRDKSGFAGVAAVCALVGALVGSLTGSPAPEAAAAAPGTQVQWFQTSEDGDRLAAQPSLTFTDDTDGAVPTIEVDSRVQHQPIDGFGASLNEVGYELLSKLPAADQDALMASVFNPDTGSGFSLTRVPMGTNDFAFLPDYTYADVAPGSTDFGLSSFTIARDFERLIPFVEAVKDAGGEFSLFASPWTAPPWMKTNQDYFNGGCLIPELQRLDHRRSALLRDLRRVLLPIRPGLRGRRDHDRPHRPPERTRLSGEVRVHDVESSTDGRLHRRLSRPPIRGGRHRGPDSSIWPASTGTTTSASSIVSPTTSSWSTRSTPVTAPG